MPRHTVKIAAIIPPSLGFERLVETAQRYEAAGLSDVLLPDHLMGLFPACLWSPEYTELAANQRSPNVYLEVMAAVAGLAMATERIGLHIGVTDPCRRHPAMLAQTALSLDHISRGRFVLGLGAGEAENIVPYGIDFKKPVSRLEETLRIVRLLWSTDEPVSFDGEFWQLKDAVLGLRPYGKRPPPIWVGAMGPRMLEICARYGDGWLPVWLTVEEYGEKLAMIKRLGAGYGRDLSNISASFNPFCLILDRHEEAHSLMEKPLARAFALMAQPNVYRRHGRRHPFGDDFHGLQHYIPTRYTKEEILDAIERIPFEVVHDVFFHGTPEELCEQLEQYAEQGLNHAHIAVTTGFLDVRKLPISIDGLVRIARYFADGSSRSD